MSLISSHLQLTTFQFETKLLMCIRMGITILIYFIWGGILSNIKSEITFMTPLVRRLKTKFLTVYPIIYLYKGIQLFPNHPY